MEIRIRFIQSTHCRPKALSMYELGVGRGVQKAREGGGGYDRKGLRIEKGLRTSTTAAPRTTFETGLVNWTETEDMPAVLA